MLLTVPCIDHGKTGNKGGYHNGSLNGKQVMFHRVVFFYAYGFMPEVVMHSCDNPRCINPLHLQAGTRESNMADASIKQRNTGNFRRLSDTAVREIRASIDSQCELARRYDVARSVIQNILQFKTYREVI